MCGIAGVVHGTPGRHADPQRVQRMCDVIRHRGPDDEGFYVAGEVGLGVRRLKIIDLETGGQPIHNEDKTVWVVFNGEIYNYRELRQRLEDKGHRFYTRSDTETIVHLYEEYGTGCVSWLRGMFGFAIWDSVLRRLMLARDRVGEKQLYYTVQGDTLAFGSEIKTLLEDPAFDRRLDPVAARDFFTYLYVPGERTIFEGIHRLPPGHVLLWQNGRHTVERYWRLDRTPHPARESALIEEFRERFEQAVEMRLVSDVPVGAFLSGGIDSSAIVAVMARRGSGRVRTFTIGYEAEGVSYEERPFARLVADRYATEHHEFVVKPDVAGIVPDIVRAFDEPFGDSSAIPNWYVSKLTRQHVTVALSGVGGDEIGAGYERYAGALLAEHYRKIPRALREGVVARLVRRLPDGLGGGMAMDRLKRFVAGAGAPLAERYQRYVSVFTPDTLGALLRPDARAAMAGGLEDGPLARTFAALHTADPLGRMLLADIAMYLPDDLLVLSDRLSMAHSLEVRAPFLDHELLEFAATIPSSLKLRHWTKKYLLRRAFAPLLPPEILRRGKKGFSVPLAAWFRGALKPFLLDWLGDPLARTGLFDRHAVQRLVEEHLSFRENHENRLWALLIFAIWYEEYMA